jgi:hypothetical protein
MVDTGDQPDAYKNKENPWYRGYDRTRKSESDQRGRDDI